MSAADFKKHTLPSLLDLEKFSLKTPVKVLSLRRPQPPSTGNSTANSRNTSPKRNVSQNHKSSFHSPSQKPQTTPHKLKIIDRDVTLKLEARNSKGFGNLPMSSKGLESRPLKKLYTAAMHKHFSTKLEGLRQKYENLYKSTSKDESTEIEAENIKDLVLKSQNLFNSSYSVKYFGLKNDQIGVLSKRVSLGYRLGIRQNRTINPHNSYLNQSESHEENMTKSQDGEIENGGYSYLPVGIPHKKTQVRNLQSEKKLKKITKVLTDKISLKPWDSINGNRIDEVEELTTKEAEERETSKNNGKYTKSSLRYERTTNRRSSYKSMEVNFAESSYDYSRDFNSKSIREGLEKITENEKGSLEEIKGIQSAQDIASQREIEMRARENKPSDVIKTRANNIEQKILSPYLSNLDKDLQKFLTPTSPEGYMVTRYVLPRKLQAYKKEGERKSERQIKGLQKQGKEQTENNLANFARNLKTLSKVKRTIMRNVNLRLDDDEYADDFNVLEQYRTHELKELTASVGKYSYSKLIGSLDNSGGFENELEEKGKLLGQMMQKRREKRFKEKEHNITKGSTMKGWHKETDDVEENLTYGTNQGVKVQCAEDNEMYNTFVRIKRKME